MTAAPGVPERIAQLILPLRQDPTCSAVLCDVDGTLAPIAADPGDARVPLETQRALRELARRFALVACVSGRRAAEARRLVGVDELTYVGNHGLELLEPGAEQPELDPAVADRARAARELVLELEAAELDGAGLRIEDKGPIQALHWRTAADPDGAERQAREIAAVVQAAKLVPHWGRKVLEIRPTGEVHKGTAVRRLVASADVRRALFAGDDRTDLDAFGALRAMAAEGRLRAAVCIGISSPEAPAGLAEEADGTVQGPEQLREVLWLLAEPPAEAAGAA